MAGVPLAKVKAKFSSYVNEAALHGKITLISNHVDTVAALVPAAMAAPKRRKRVIVTEADLQASLDEIARTTDPAVSAVQDMLDSLR